MSQNGKGSRRRVAIVPDKQIAKSWKGVYAKVKCKFCDGRVSKRAAHRHQSKWVGECCWDERLKITE